MPLDVNITTKHVHRQKDTREGKKKNMKAGKNEEVREMKEEGNTEIKRTKQHKHSFVAFK
jgi:hypothetical protein